MKRNYHGRATLVASLLLLGWSACSYAESLTDQWRKGLSGARLTAYSGSVISSNSTLTVVDICSNGRYSYYKEGSWSASGAAGGSSSNRITGRWDIRQSGTQVLITYVTDNGDRGSFPIYLQNNGRVNIGGVAYAIQQGGSGC